VATRAWESQLEVAPTKGSVIERLLSPITEVRPGEAKGSVLMALVMFLILGAYYILKTAREALILSEGGAAVKSYSAAGQAILLLFLVPAFAALASRVNRIRLVRWVTLFFVAHLGLFFLIGESGTRIGIVYFLWVGIFSVMVVAQFWAFANDLYTQEQGKRLFPLIGLGSSVGAWVGSLYAGRLIRVLGTYPMLLVAGAILAFTVVIATFVHKSAARLMPQEQAAMAEQPLGKEGAFELIRKDKYLLLIALLVVLLNLVNSSGEYLLGRYAVTKANDTYGTSPESKTTREAFIGQTYSRFFSTVNLAGFLLQLFVVSRVFKFLGVGKALFIHPLTVFLGYLAVAWSPSIGRIYWLKVVDNSLDYSLGNTTKQALWLPTSREAKYKAKQAVDSFFMRAGDVLQAGVVFGGERLAFTTSSFSILNLVMTGGWLSVVLMLNVLLHRKAQEASTADL
jgi:ATP:ADP antiporter, AAA family